jgi:glutamine synthetase
VELRSPDPACNPYLALAVCLEAGLDGIRRGLTPPEPIQSNIFAMDDQQRQDSGIISLPGGLGEAVEAMEQDPLVLDTLGGHAASAYLEGKNREWDSYRTSVSQWEVDRYLVRY